MQANETLEQLIEVRKRLDVLKASPDVQEALRLQDEFQRLSEALTKQPAPTYVPVPYPVYPQPVYPWWQYHVTTKTTSFNPAMGCVRTL